MKKFKQPWLIQRLNAPTNYDNPFSFGGGRINGGFTKESMALLRSIFSFDYMGSAEFEFGAVPEAFQRLYESNLTTLFIKSFKDIHIICPVDIQGSVVEWLNLAIDGEQGRTKEWLDLQEVIAGEKYADTKGWIELDNPFMFFVDKEMFEKTWNLFSKELV